MMDKTNWKNLIKSYDQKWDVVIPGDQASTIRFCVDHFVEIANESILDHNYFAVALSGGKTPKAIYQALVDRKNSTRIDWTKVLLFWSDEREVPPNDPNSNYYLAMEAGFRSLPIPLENIFRMQAEEEIERNALVYENLILTKIPLKRFDLVILGVGEDGHTASLFPKTHGLHAPQRLVIANFIPQINAWRMTLTFECINQAQHIAIYVLGKSKAQIVKRVLSSPSQPDLFPIQAVGTPVCKALWIVDEVASQELNL